MDTAADEARNALREHLRAPRYEIFPAEGVADELSELVPREVKVTVTASPRLGMDATLELAEEISRRGYRVAPHLSARLIRDSRELEEILDRLREAGVRDAFVVAGDAKQAAGEFEGAFELLAAMTGLGHDLVHVGITGYPESHPFISNEATIQAMYEKAPHATYIVSQVCFEPRTIVSWIAAVRERGVDLPIDIGIPGVASRAKLVRIARRIGVGESVAFLAKRRSWVTQLLKPAGYSPDHIVTGILPTLSDPASDVAGFHVYTFNELGSTERWRRRTLARLA
jgi:methylenetetrahydrofolate reductase (NADPH)